jgi:hypothetical protein
LLCLGEALPEEFHELVFRKKFGLLASIYFLHDTFQPAVVRGPPQLDYKCSSHDEFRIRPLALIRVEIPWNYCPDRIGMNVIPASYISASRAKRFFVRCVFRVQGRRMSSPGSWSMADQLFEHAAERGFRLITNARGGGRHRSPIHHQAGSKLHPPECEVVHWWVTHHRRESLRKH